MKNISRFIFSRAGVSLLFCLMIGLAALLAPWLSPRDPLAADLSCRLAAPCPEFPLGTDQLGRCVLSRILWGLRLSLGGALAASGLAVGAGTLLGIGAALAKGWVGILFRAAIDMGLAIPGLILAIVFAGLAPGTMQGLIIGLAAANWPWWARLIRGLALSSVQKEFVLAGRAAGLKSSRIVLAYILPQFKNPVLAGASLKTGRIILAFAGLSYLGLGPPPPVPELGRMLQEAGIYMARAPWLVFGPGISITLAVAALNLAGKTFQREFHDV
ncbi:ABC transporter permease [Desulfospira joergensenii]|uniref:ABC transporter permease n=1 Tax=Desulfospira joergensenii TaxID=53329 RepID=UPI0003B30BDA|nr:ABC transporter permease subunit [Desulfospira joergensenii]